MCPPTTLRPAPPLALLLLAPLVAGCTDDRGSSTGDAASVVVRDSAGFRIVESPVDDALPRWQLATEAILRVGSEEFPLERVSGAARTPDGGIVVADGGANQLFWFDADGRRVEVSGGPGEGPGEYQFLASAFGVPGDSVAATDAFSGWVNLYGPERRLERSWRVDVIGRFNRPAPFARLADHTFVSSIDHTDDPYPGHQRYETLLLRYTEGRLTDTVARHPGPDGYTVYCGPDQSAVCTVGVPYGAVRARAAAGQIIVAAVPDGSLQVFQDGEASRILRLGDPPVPVTPEAVAHFIDSLTADYPPDRAIQARERLAEAPSAEMYPRFVDVAIDPLGRIWAARGDAEPGRWDVFSPEGRRIASLVLPPRVQVWQIGPDWLLWSKLDDFDVPTVEVVAFESG